MADLTDIVCVCENSPNVKLYQPFLQHFSDIDFACVLSEICVHSSDALKADPHGEGFFPRTYEEWEILTGIPASRTRKVSMELSEQGYIRVEIRKRVSHFRAVPETIARLLYHVLPLCNGRPSIGKCPECGEDVIEGKRSFHCSGWEKGKKCRFCLWKDTLLHNGKNNLTEEEARLLLEGKDIELREMLSFRSKNKFSCKGRLYKRESGKYGIKFIFPEKKGAVWPGRVAQDNRRLNG